MRKFLDYLLAFDFIMVNTDRHFGNFGAVRNIETLEWLGPAPVFDSGTSAPSGRMEHQPLAQPVDRGVLYIRFP